MNTKQLLALFLTFWLPLVFPSVVFAQELVTPSATPSAAAFEATDSASLEEPIATPSADLAAEASASSDLWEEDTDMLPDQLQEEAGMPSAKLKQPVRVRSLSKRTFRADEKITVVLDNTLSADSAITLFDSDGREVSATVEQVSDYDPTVFRISPPNHLRPGRYRIKITDPEGNVTTQDFSWGVLALNPDKAAYFPNETSRIAIAVLDETGNMVCDANVSLKIRKIPFGEDFPTGSEDELSTSNGTIKVNPECAIKDYVLKPDYETEYQMGEPGTYRMMLTATTREGTHTIEDAIEVRETISFDIKRTSATRIFPPKTYPMTFEIVANEDFSGTITELVPGSFAVAASGGSVAFTQSAAGSSATSSAATADAVIPVLTPPFDHLHPINLGFGQQLRDPLLEKKYSDFGLLGHDGVDFDLAEGTPVLSVDDGTVVRVRENGDYGQTVVIQHAWGKSYYGHLSLITANEGNSIARGHPLGLSGSTGLSTGPHLHFGVKPNDNDMDNGYYGKINPLPYLALQEGNQDVLGEQTEAPKPVVVATDTSNNQVIRWNVSLKKGEKTTLGYTYQVPNVSPQFYLLGPLTFENEAGERVYQEGRRWQLAIDADGSGTNSVNPTTGSTNATGQTYTFTFTAAETMDSGEFTISVPAGWSAPQGTGGTAGYTTAVGNSNATVARVLNNADSLTGWAEDDTDMCNTANLALDATTKQEGTNSIKCDNSGSTLMDISDSFSLDFTSENWSSYNQLALWVRTTYSVVSGDIVIGYDDAVNCGNNSNANLLQSFNFTTTANTWEYKKFTLTATRTAVVAFCVNAGTDGLDSDSLWIDDVLIGPGVPTFSGSGPWTISSRILDAANTETFTVTYGDTAGGAGSTVTNSSTEGVHTFTTQSRANDAGTLTNIASHPTVTLSAPAGPTTDQQMRHGNWFSGGVEQSFTF